MKRRPPLPLLSAAALAFLAFGLLGERALRAVRLTAESSVRDRLRAAAEGDAARARARFGEWSEGVPFWRVDADGRFTEPSEPEPLVPMSLPPGTPERLAFFLREAERAEHADGDLRTAAGLYRTVAAETEPEAGPAVRIALSRLAALEGRRGNAEESRRLWNRVLSVAGETEYFLIAALEGAEVEKSVVADFLVRHLGTAPAVAAYADRLGILEHPTVARRVRQVDRMDEIRPHLLPPPAPGTFRAIRLDGGAVAFLRDGRLLIAEPEDLTEILGPQPVGEGEPGVSVPGLPPLDGFAFRAAAEPGEVVAVVRRQATLLLGAVGLAALAGGASLLMLFRSVRRETDLARLKSEFVANVSHELRTPLALVRLYAETLAKGRVPDGEEPEYAGVVLRETESLTRLVDRVLDFSRIERGTKEYDLRSGDLRELVGQACDRWPDHEIEFDLPDAPVPARIDGDALAAAVGNLVDNAVRHAGEEGIALRLSAGDGIARIEVLDRGPGLDADEAARVFDRFHRGARAHRDAVRGSGLGLTLARHAARGHGGDAGYRDREGGGAVFYLELPAEET